MKMFALSTLSVLSGCASAYIASGASERASEPGDYELGLIKCLMCLTACWGRM